MLFAEASTTAAPELVLQGKGEAAEAQIRTDDTVLAVASGFVFPSTLAEMPIRKVYVYGPGDTASYYTLYGAGNGDPFVTLYVYPKPMAFDLLVEDTEGALRSRMPNASVIAPLGPLPQGAEDGVQKWFFGTYGDLENATTGFVIVERGGWVIKARATMPPDEVGDKAGRLLRALNAIDWGWTAKALPEATKSQSAF